MGPLLWRDHYNLYYPGDPNSQVVPNYYDSEYKDDKKVANDDNSEELVKKSDKGITAKDTNETSETAPVEPDADGPKKMDEDISKAQQNDLKAIERLSWAHPRRLLATARFIFLRGITRDVIGHQNKGLDHIHSRAPQFDNKVEHLWTTAQVCSAMIMSVAHGANDVSNAIGPFTTEYLTWKTGVASQQTDTPTWIKAVGGLGLGVGFWTFG